MKKIITLAICLILTLSILGCSASTPTPATATPAVTETPVASAAPIAPEATEAAEPTEEPAPAEEERQITDMAGREITLPPNVTKAYGTDPVGTIALYTLAPEKLIGWNYELNDTEKQHIPEEYQSLPIYGMRDNFNAEAVIAAAPEVIIQMGAIDEKAAKQADELQAKLNIPVAVLSGKITDIPTAYVLLGDITGDDDKAIELASYSQAVLDKVTSVEIPEDEKVSVYYGNGVDSLETAPTGSDAAEVIELAGGVNIANLDIEDPNERMIVSKEQLLAWDPDFIFVNGEPKKDISGGGAADAVINDADLSSLKAVQAGEVYGIPKSPFAWLDRPKAPNRIIGLLWAGSVMYPDQYTDIDILLEIKDFYKLFYHTTLDDSQALELLEAK